MNGNKLQMHSKRGLCLKLLFQLNVLKLWRNAKKALQIHFNIPLVAACNPAERKGKDQLLSVPIKPRGKMPCFQESGPLTASGLNLLMLSAEQSTEPLHPTPEGSAEPRTHWPLSPWALPAFQRSSSVCGKKLLPFTVKRFSAPYPRVSSASIQKMRYL